MCYTMLVQRFEPQDRCFTNFHYYYYYIGNRNYPILGTRTTQGTGTIQSWEQGPRREQELSNLGNKDDVGNRNYPILGTRTTQGTGTIQSWEQGRRREQELSNLGNKDDIGDRNYPILGTRTIPRNRDARLLGAVLGQDVFIRCCPGARCFYYDFHLIGAVLGQGVFITILTC